MPRRFPLSAATLLRLRAELRSRRLQAMSVVLIVTLAMTLAAWASRAGQHYRAV